LQQKSQWHHGNDMSLIGPRPLLRPAINPKIPPSDVQFGPELPDGLRSMVERSCPRLLQLGATCLLIQARAIVRKVRPWSVTCTEGPSRRNHGPRFTISLKLLTRVSYK
jgi:hypothetical protein